MADELMRDIILYIFYITRGLLLSNKLLGIDSNFNLLFNVAHLLSLFNVSGIFIAVYLHIFETKNKT